MPLPCASFDNINFNPSAGGVAANSSGCLELLNSLATNRDLYLGAIASPLFISIHRTPIGFFPVAFMHLSIDTFL